MADNKRWFKVWTSILTDPDMADCHNDIAGAWVRLGALIAQHGNNGKINISKSHFYRIIHLYTADDVTVQHFFDKLKTLNIKIKSCNDTFSVTFEKWHKYQVDNSSERVKKYRQNVTVQEEKRREEKRREKEEKKTPNPEAKKLASLLGDLILENNPSYRELNNRKTDKTLQRWSADIDRLIRIDKKKVDEIEKVIKFAQNDSFWKANILSGAKLRDKYDQLRMKMDKNGGYYEAWDA